MPSPTTGWVAQGPVMSVCTQVLFPGNQGGRNGAYGGGAGLGAAPASPVTSPEGQGGAAGLAAIPAGHHIEAAFGPVATLEAFPIYAADRWVPSLYDAPLVVTGAPNLVDATWSHPQPSPAGPSTGPSTLEKAWGELDDWERAAAVGLGWQADEKDWPGGEVGAALEQLPLDEGIKVVGADGPAALPLLLGTDAEV